jgi:ABC-type uncharacterized transport system substrate-binding protein
VPTVYFDRLFVEARGLIAYNTDFSEELRQAAGYVDRIIRGVKLSDPPIQQPIKCELAINLKTVTALGINLPKFDAIARPRADRIGILLLRCMGLKLALFRHGFRDARCPFTGAKQT